MLESKNYSIEKNPARIEAEDYDLLRSYGIDHIQKLSSNLWTDHNVHDPGITILELLCYALTDLGYRTSFDIADILTPKGEKGPEMRNAFFSAKKILTCHPITINDYRKLIIEKVPGVRNVWFETEDNDIYNPPIGFDPKKNANIFVKSTTPEDQKLKLKGLFKVKVELEDFKIISAAHKDILEKLKAYKANTNTPVNNINYKTCYENYILSILTAYRNIGEDFDKVSILKDVPVGICADIELKPNAREQNVLVEIYRRLYEYINPSVKLYTFQQLLDKGRSMEQIFQGTTVDRGFIDYEELSAFDRKTTLHISDLINIIMDIDEVQSIRNIQFNLESCGLNNDYFNKSCLHLENPDTDSFRFQIDINKSDDKLNKIIFRKGMIYYLAQATKEYKITEVIEYSDKPQNFESDLPLPTGNYRELDTYISIQDEFPKAYMLGREGIPDSAGDLRKAQRLQLKAYLLFFDQLLADYLAQLDSVKDLLSWRDPAAEETYNFKKLTGEEIYDLDKILSEELVSDYDKYQPIIEHVKLEKNRRSRLLDHLMARFNEKFVDYTVFKFMQDSEGSSYTHYANNEIINDKKDFLRHYPAISGNRSHAIDYTHPLTADNYNMLELRISKALGVDSDNVNRLLAPEVVDNNPLKMIFKNNSGDDFNKTFGLHIYEHILFRPLCNDSISPEQEFLKLYYGTGSAGCDDIIKDPYSMKATVVVPGWLHISGRMEFRRFVEQKIRMEMPAHVAVKICWIDPRQMYEIETKFQAFVNSLNELFKPGNNKVQAVISAYKTALNEAVISLSSLNNMFPPSALEEVWDYITGNVNLTPVILDNTALAGGDDRNWDFSVENTDVTPKKKEKSPKKKKKTK